MMDENTLSLTALLIDRLERISADSVWAHKASGVKGSLLRIIEEIDKGETEEAQAIKKIMAFGFHILEQAAKEKK
jgi:hypothetical protein